MTRRSQKSTKNCSAFEDSFVRVSDIQDESSGQFKVTPKAKNLFSHENKENKQNNSAFNDSFLPLSMIQDQSKTTPQKVGNTSVYNESQLATMLETQNLHQISNDSHDQVLEEVTSKNENDPNDEEIVAELDLMTLHDFDAFCQKLVKLQQLKTETTQTPKSFVKKEEEISPEYFSKSQPVRKTPVECSVKSPKVKSDEDRSPEFSVKSQPVKKTQTPNFSLKSPNVTIEEKRSPEFSVKSQPVNKTPNSSVKSPKIKTWVRRDTPESLAILKQIEKTVEKFKMPNLEDFESRAVKVTPRALKFSQSPLVPVKTKKRAVISSSDEDEEHHALSPKVRKPKMKKPRNKFIDDEAELSGEASEDDESNENLDTYDQSFLDDDQDQAIPNLDEKAIYLRSIKSPEMNYRKLKPLKHMEKEDIYSQEVTDSMMLDDYQEDSFCVEDDDEIEYEDSPDELDFVPEFNNDTDKVRRPAKTSKDVMGAKKRKRILMSSSDEEEIKIATPKASKVTVTPSLSTPKNVSKSTTDSIMSFQESPGSVSISAKDKSVTPKLQKPKVIPGVPECGVTIVANPVEVHKSHDLISSLKHTHGLTVCVQKGFDSAGYLLSTRLAVSRVKNSDLCNGAQRHKLVEIVQTLNEYYERAFLIIETTENQQVLEMRQNRSKYIDMIICQLATSNIRILYSQNIEETSGFLAKLAKKEARKKFSLPPNLKLPELSEDFVPMYQEIPGVSLALAMQMCIAFENPSELFTAALATLIRKLKIDEKRAQKIHEFCRHELKLENVSDGDDSE